MAHPLPEVLLLVVCGTEIVRSGRNTKAAKRLLTRLLKKQGITPKRMITDKLRSYGAARRHVMPNVEHRSHKSLNNRTENSHVPLRTRDRMMHAFDHREVCNASSLSSRPEISTFRPVHNVLQFKAAFTASKRLPSGKLRPEPWSDINP